MNTITLHVHFKIQKRIRQVMQNLSIDACGTKEIEGGTPSGQCVRFRLYWGDFEYTNIVSRTISFDNAGTLCKLIPTLPQY